MIIPKDTLILINTIRGTEKKLSRIESGFISSVFVQAKANRLLTERQSKCLQDIYGKVTSL